MGRSIHLWSKRGDRQGKLGGTGSHGEEGGGGASSDTEWKVVSASALFS